MFRTWGVTLLVGSAAALVLVVSIPEQGTMAGAVAVVAVGLMGWLCHRNVRARHSDLEVLLQDSNALLAGERLPDPQKDPVNSHAQFDRIRANLSQLFDNVVEATDLLAEGNLGAELPVRGLLHQSFVTVAASQLGLVHELAAVSAQLGGAAAQIQAASREQEASASTQSASLDEIHRTAVALSDSASHISRTAASVLRNAEKVSTISDKTAGSIADLTTTTGRIAEVLEVIRDISDRSNLLALNASLEATRAGEAGRGFALLAVEMRRLAERVTGSVEDIKTLLSDAKRSSSTTIMTIEQSRALASENSDAAEHIALVTQQQRVSTEQVAESIGDLNEMLIQSIESVLQTRQLSIELKNQADVLGLIVTRYG